MLSFIGNPNFALNNKIFEEKLEDIDTKIEEKIEELGKSSNDIISTTEKTLIDSKEGGLKLISISGDTVQSTDPLPTPDAPQEIKNVVVSEIKVTGKNLLKVTATTQTKNGVTFTVNDDGSVTVNGTATADISINIAKVYNLKANTKYIFSGLASNTAMIYMDGVGGISGWTVPNTKGFTPLKDVPTYGVWLYVKNETTLTDVTFYPMIRSADITDDTFEPYHEKSIQLSAPITLRGIGDAKDVLCKQDGVFGVLRGIEEFVADGSDDENWSLNSTNDTYKLNNFVCRLLSSITYADNHCICSHFTKDWNLISDATKEGMYLTKLNYYFLRVSKDRCGSLNSFKTWLSENPVTLIYELATPTFEQLPTADQIALHGLETFDEVTHIFTDSEIEPVIEVEYGTSQVGAYAIKGMNDVEADKILSKINISDTALNRQTLGYTKKNIMLPKFVSLNKTVSGVTFTDNGDGSIHVKGTSTALINFAIVGNIAKKIDFVSAGTKLTFSNTSDKCGVMFAPISSGTTLSTSFTVFNGEKSMTLNNDSDTTDWYIAIFMYSGVTIDETIYPMIRSADIADDTYEPYVDDVDTRLNTAKSENAINKQTLGYSKKNLVQLVNSTTSANGVDIVSNTSNGTVVFNGKATVYTYINASGNRYIKAGKYKLTGCPVGGKIDGIEYYRQTLVVVNANGSQANNIHDYGEGATFEFTHEMVASGMYVFLVTAVFANYNANNLTFYPMIRSADIVDDTFEPYVDDIDTRLKNNNTKFNTINTNINTINTNVNTIDAKFNSINARFNNQIGDLIFSVNANGILEITY